MLSQEANPFSAELCLRPKPSRLLLIFIGCSHACAIGVLSAVPALGGYARLLLFVGVLLSAGYFLLLHSHLLPAKAVKTLYWREFGGWELVNGQGQQLPVILADSSFSSLALTVLNFKTRPALGGQRYTVILLWDNCSLALRRHLRMRMKLYLANR